MFIAISRDARNCDVHSGDNNSVADCRNNEYAIFDPSTLGQQESLKKTVLTQDIKRCPVVKDSVYLFMLIPSPPGCFYDFFQKKLKMDSDDDDEDEDSEDEEEEDDSDE